MAFLFMKHTKYSEIEERLYIIKSHKLFKMNMTRELIFSKQWATINKLTEARKKFVKKILLKKCIFVRDKTKMIRLKYFWPYKILPKLN
jgi:hypothetical protein